MSLRLVFMGTPTFAVPSLTALVEAGHQLVCAYSQPARPAGRGKRPRPSPVQTAAESYGITVRTPESLRTDAEQSVINDFDADAVVVVAYGLLLPKPVLEAPRFGCLNVHASLLPRWRGAAPIQRALLAGDTQTGVSIMRLDEGLDTGPVLMQRSMGITGDDTTGTLHDRLAELGAELIVDTLSKLSHEHLVAVDQDDDEATYAAKIERSETELDWKNSAAQLDRQVRALAPVPGAWFRLGTERIKVFACEPVAVKSGIPGEILDDTLTVACGEGALRLRRLQREGRKVMDADAFLRGQAMPPGTRLVDLPA